jgi:hypothetical protein
LLLTDRCIFGCGRFRWDSGKITPTSIAAAIKRPEWATDPDFIDACVKRAKYLTDRADEMMQT